MWLHGRPNIPNQDTLTTREHGIYINGKLVRAKNLVNNKNVLKKITRRVPIYNVLLNEHHKMTVNNMTVETLHPDSIK